MSTMNVFNTRSQIIIDNNSPHLTRPLEAVRVGSGSGVVTPLEPAASGAALVVLGRLVQGHPSHRVLHRRLAVTPGRVPGLIKRRNAVHCNLHVLSQCVLMIDLRD